MSIRTTLARNGVLIFFAVLIAAGFGYYWYLHRKPYTDNAFVIANVRPVAALVPGHITHIYVANNTHVTNGQELFTVYKRPYELAVDQLSHEVTAKEYGIMALKAEITKNTAQIEQYKAEHDNAQYMAKRIRILAEENADSKSEAEQYTRKEQAAKARLKMAQSTLGMSTHQLNKAIAEIKGLRAQFEQAKIDLEQTTVYAKKNGSICNMHMSAGAMVKPGETLFAFVESDRWWVQANLKETALTHVRPGQHAKIELRIYPDYVFHGIVEEIGWGVNRQLTSQETGLPMVTKENEWFLLPQRFPVQILITNIPPHLPLHIGASAYVTIDTDS